MNMLNKQNYDEIKHERQFVIKVFINHYAQTMRVTYMTGIINWCPWGLYCRFSSLFTLVVANLPFIAERNFKNKGSRCQEFNLHLPVQAKWDTESSSEDALQIHI